MKRTTIIMMIAGGLALQALGAGTASNPSATTTRKSTAQQRAYQFVGPRITKTDKIDRVGGTSSRAWAQSAGWASSQVQFAGDRERFNEPQFNVFWLGSTPP